MFLRQLDGMVSLGGGLSQGEGDMGGSVGLDWLYIQTQVTSGLQGVTRIPDINKTGCGIRDVGCGIG